MAIQGSYTRKKPPSVGVESQLPSLEGTILPKLPQSLFGHCHSFMLPSWPLYTTESVTHDPQYQTQSLCHDFPSPSKHCSNLNTPGLISSHTPPINTCHHVSFPTMCPASYVLFCWLLCSEYSPYPCPRKIHYSNHHGSTQII